jgi:alpha-amylase
MTPSATSLAAVGLLAVVLLFAAETAEARVRTSAEWQGRRIYQVMTDRFSRTDNSNAPSCDVNQYCGGSYQGLVNQLDYIAGMGFNAIWISPIVQNYQGGYHGYWATNWFAVNPNFGSEQDLINFVNACHSRGIWVMLDIVVNHAGPVGTDYSQVYPFNQSEHYHSQCQVSQYVCFTEEVYTCRLADLPDLNQTVPFVREQLTKALLWALNTFDFDGLRADTVMYIDQGYWSQLWNAIGQPYIAGEVWSDFSCNLAYAQYGVPATINYPLYYAVRNVFQSNGNMQQLGTAWRQQATLPHPQWELNFVDNQDNDRFLQATSSIPCYKSALAYIFFTDGVPTVYYGTEQYFQGTVSDNTNRQALWPSNYAQTDMYNFLKKVNGAYSSLNVTNYAVEERWQDESFYCLIRGPMMLCATNTDSQSQTRTIPNLPFAGLGTVCDYFSGGYCQNGQATMTITINAGDSPILIMKQQ